MGRGGDGDFVERDRRGATNFAEAAKAAGVERIVYLGGLGEGKSEHLRSRHETAEALASTGIPLTYFRAAVVIGSGSESLHDDRLPGQAPAGDGHPELDRHEDPADRRRRRRRLPAPPLRTSASRPAARSRSAAPR